MSQDPSFTKVYIDGSFFGRVGQAGIGVHWESNTARDLAERCPREQGSCSTRAEIHAFRRFLEQIGARTDCSVALPHNKFFVYSDSLETINNFTQLRKHHKRRGFTSRKGVAILHADIIAYTEALLENAENWVSITLEYVPGHDKISGNEAADKLAKRGARSYIYAEAPDWIRLEKEVRATSAETKRLRLRQNQLETETRARKVEEEEKRKMKGISTLRLSPLVKRSKPFCTYTPIEISSDDESEDEAAPAGARSIPPSHRMMEKARTVKRKLEECALPPLVKRSRSLASTPIEISSDDTLVDVDRFKANGAARHLKERLDPRFGLAAPSSKPGCSSYQGVQNLPSGYSSDSPLSTQSIATSSPSTSQIPYKPSQSISAESRRRRLHDITKALNAKAQETSRKARVQERRVEVIRKALAVKKRKDELAELAGCLLDDAELEREIEGL